MKQILSFILVLFFSVGALAQSDLKTEVIKVQGNCGMCKTRIEEAAHIKGVKRAEWNKETKELTVLYRPEKTNAETISKSVAKAGHATETVQASEKGYKNLPKCCKYKTSVCND